MEISADNVERAYQIIAWHLDEAKRIFNGNSLTQTECDAQSILNNVITKNITQTTLREINRITSIRDTKRRDNAIQWLEEEGYLQKTIEGRSILLTFCLST